jgi:hypothetical protein
VIREQRVEVFEPVGGTMEDEGGFGGWPTGHPESPTRFSPSALHSLPSCRRPQFAHDLGRGVKERRSAEQEREPHGPRPTPPRLNFEP